MAFSFGTSTQPSSNSQAQVGPDLEEIQTEALGFLSLAGDTKLRLLPNPWPSEALPPPTASLFSIASNKALVAAASPDALVIATTDAVRQAYGADGPAENNIKAFTPQAAISVPRVSQVAFTADETYLVICAESGGGLAVYDVAAILQGNKEPSFQIGTNNTGVRALVPNPAIEFAQYLAIVLTDGSLVIADLKGKQLVNGQAGPKLKDGVSCVSWSARGKQLVAGLGNGTAYQMTPDGVGKAEVPRPPQLEGDQHVSAISWLANDTFLLIHTPTSFDKDSPPSSTYHLVNRQKGTSNYTFQKLQDPCPPFGANRSPPHHFITRLRDFPPHLTDALILSSTTSGDVGLFANSQAPLTSDVPADKITNVYTTTTMAVDSRRAQLPVTEEMTDTSPIGMALDLSSRDRVKRPIPSEEIESTSGPLPALMILNNEGILSAWWIVYNDSVRQNTVYPGLVAVDGTQHVHPLHQPPQQRSVFGAAAQPLKPAFGEAGSGSSFVSNALGGSFPKPPAPAFGSTSTVSGAFGAPSMPGSTKSVWSTPATSITPAHAAGAAFSKPAFGSTTAFGGPAVSAFGSLGGMGNRASPWGTPQSTNTADKPANPFAAASTSSVSPFASIGASSNKASPFATAASKDTPMSSFGGSATPKGPPEGGFGSGGGFAGLNTEPSFGSTISIGSGGTSFGALSTLGSNKSPWVTVNNTPSVGGASATFGQPAVASPESREATMAIDDGYTEVQKDPEARTSLVDKSSAKPSGLLGAGASGFKLGSTFKGDGSAKDDLPKAAVGSGNSLFGAGFGSALGEVQQTPVTPVKKEPGTEEGPKLQDISTTPASPPPQQSATDVRNAQVDAPTASRIAPARHPSLLALKKAGDDGKVKERVQELEKKRTGTSVEPEPAPLPPSSKSQKPAAEEDIAPVAGSPPVDLGEPEPAPLPPSPKPQKPAEEENIPHGAGSPPVDLGESGSSPLSSPSSSVSSKEDYSEAEQAPLPPDFLTAKRKHTIPEDGQLPPDSTQKVPANDKSKPPFAPNDTWSFGTAASKRQDQFTASTTPLRSPTPLAIDNRLAISEDGPVFPPPVRNQESRSPSPVRDPSRPVKSSAAASSKSGSLQASRPVSRPVSRPISRQISRRQSASANQRLRKSPPPGPASAPLPPPKQDVEEAVDVSDEEDERIREELSSDLKPSRTLDPFIAHQDYVSQQPEKPGIPGQIERVYRDINSMIDTLGLNARSLRAFIKGHEEGFRDEITKENLENDEDWILVEIDDLMMLEGSIERELDQGMIKDTDEKMGLLREMAKVTGKLRSKILEIKKVIHAKTDQEQVAILKAVPLSTEQSLLQQDLRRGFVNLQKLLTDAEEGISLLRAKISEASALNGADGRINQAPQQPTVEAVISTIEKMTAMIEKRSGDVDVLEMHMRRLRLATPGGVAASREASPFVTPPMGSSGMGKSTAIMRNTGTYALTYSTDSSTRASSPPTQRSSVMKSRLALGMSGMTLGGGSPAVRRMKMNEVRVVDVEAYNERVRRRGAALVRLREAVRKRGVRVTRPDD